MVPTRMQPVLDAVRPLAERFVGAGFRAYLVGGAVRDALLPDSPTHDDLDLTTDARPDQIKAVLNGWADSVWTQGEAFGTIGCAKGDQRYEITTHRAEAYDPDSRKPEVEFGERVEDDLARRDFTVNAMALEVVPEPQLVDPYGGAADLAAKRLRTPLAPEESFSDDPLRMMRAARFIARFGLVPDDDLVRAVPAMAERLDIVSAERIRDELDKLIVVDDPGPGLWFLVETGLADRFLPELGGMQLEQDPIHRHKDVLAHTIAVVGNVEPGAGRHRPIDLRICRLAALFHDVGKPKTRSIGDAGVSFHHHEVVGARMTRDRMKALKYSSADIEAVSQLVFLHLRFHTYKMGWSDRAVRRYVRDAGPLLEELNVLTRSDCTTRNRRKAEALARRMDELEQWIDELREQEELDAIRPDLDGKAVMEHLGIEPGPLVGEALEMLLEVRLDEGPLGEEEARRRLDEWWAQRSG